VSNDYADEPVVVELEMVQEECAPIYATIVSSIEEFDQEADIGETTGFFEF
jgi:hypothetical protein